MTQRDVHARQIRAASQVIQSYAGITLTPAQVQDLLAAHPHLQEEIEQWGAGGEEVRNMLLDALSTQLLGRPWPTYRDEENGETFETLLDQAALAAGYALTARN